MGVKRVQRRKNAEHSVERTKNGGIKAQPVPYDGISDVSGQDIWRSCKGQKGRKTAMANYEKDMTKTFAVVDEKEVEIKRILQTVYNALNEKGYNPLDQIVGYIISEDPTYITNYKNAAEFNPPDRPG